MKAKPVVPRVLADRDVDEAIAFYLDEATESVALRFTEALEWAYAHIGRRPASGSPRYASELDIPGLRCWPVSRFPNLVFYLEREDHADVWRVLHGRRDIPAWMREPEGAIAGEDRIRSGGPTMDTRPSSSVNEIIFLVEEAAEGGYLAHALGHSIFTEADDLPGLHESVRDAVRCHFEEGQAPQMVRLHFVRSAGGLKLPRDLSGDDLVRSLGDCLVPKPTSG